MFLHVRPADDALESILSPTHPLSHAVDAGAHADASSQSLITALCALWLRRNSATTPAVTKLDFTAESSF